MQSTPTLTPPTAALVRGEFAPVYWEPLGKRAERLVVGVLLAQDDRPAFAHVTLQHRRLAEFAAIAKADSAVGIIQFAFDHFTKTLSAGGMIQDLRAPFASMHIGRTERISATSESALLSRAIQLSTMLGQTPEAAPEVEERGRVAARTTAFLRDVRQGVRAVDRELARLAMREKQFFALGSTQIRMHFQHSGHYVLFCTLPLPTARPELATECSARLTELAGIHASLPQSQVALCINTQTMALSRDFHGKRNATVQVLERTQSLANTLGIETRQCETPTDAAAFLRQRVGRDRVLG